ncbi:MAG TPA: DUF559 domain-containing protein [Gryllotalpicola sp.]
MLTPLCAFGHVATTAELTDAGWTRTQRESALRQGARRVRKGTFACTHLEEADRFAVDCGGRLDCISVLRAEGIWAGFHRGLHLRMNRGDRHAMARVRAAKRRATLHWDHRRFPAESRTRVSVQDALIAAMRCLPPDDVVAAIESAVHLRRITASQAFAVMEAAPRRLQRQMSEVDTGFRAQSGYETHVRLRLRRRGHRVEPQYLVPGVGHLDNLVDGVVAVETDGSQHRDSLPDDHRRDLGTEAAGIRVLRIDPDLVDRRWDEVLDVIERMVRDAQRAQASPTDTDSVRKRPWRRK